jgi:hypothetical protein
VHAYITCLSCRPQSRPYVGTAAIRGTACHCELASV